MRTLILVGLLGSLVPAGVAQEVREVRAILPDPQAVDEFEAPEALNQIEDRTVILLDLTMSVEAYPSFENADGTYSGIDGDCEFGVMDGVRMLSIPTGSNHLLLSVRPGNPETHQANSVACEYMPSLQLGENIGQVMRVRGCYLANYISIPTAAQYVLNPLPASACGLTH